MADAAAVAALYADGAAFSSHPFRPDQPPAAYVGWAFGDQAHADCRFGQPVVDGRRAVVDWWAVVTARDGSQETLAGSSFLRFDAGGLVVEQRDVWASAPGRHAVPGWARSS